MSKHVTSEAERRRCYGFNWNTKELHIAVVDINNCQYTNEKQGNDDSNEFDAHTRTCADQQDKYGQSETCFSS